MVRSNAYDLPTISVQGEIDHPRLRSLGFVDPSGHAQLVALGTSGIAYDVRIGDRAVGWAADHVEPGVSIRHSDVEANLALAYNSCVGNRAIVVSGRAQGAEGVVTGKHGGALPTDRLLVDFSPDVLDKLVIGDSILIRSRGQGLVLPDHPGVSVRNLDPNLLDRLPISEVGGVLSVGVAARIPARVMGSGIGMGSVALGDYDINLFDAQTVEEFGLDRLRLGDLVHLEDTDNRFGRSYRKGMSTIAVVAHSDSVLAGHGPGVVTLFSGSDEDLVAVDDPAANLADIWRV
ncbi:DUF4438 domain-containing protein [Xylanimonas ulmi]|uniref:Uncharacterized protein DUF4438 n=1 Tax=Xylanimonas ulmi TaxID=228973 RepID=A0A4Q7M080_9MICO|nr:DUF4438 domain-containing protein [Xylanibacterium ulmi]RZS60734.1 uncharacterized protein DUF4438 [Xylanibacterium ulmi]